MHISSRDIKKTIALMEEFCCSKSDYLIIENVTNFWRDDTFCSLDFIIIYAPFVTSYISSTLMMGKFKDNFDHLFLVHDKYRNIDKSIGELEKVVYSNIEAQGIKLNEINSGFEMIFEIPLQLNAKLEKDTYGFGKFTNMPDKNFGDTSNFLIVGIIFNKK